MKTKRKAQPLSADAMALRVRDMLDRIRAGSPKEVIGGDPELVASLLRDLARIKIIYPDRYAALRELVSEQKQPLARQPRRAK